MVDIRCWHDAAIGPRAAAEPAYELLAAFLEADIQGSDAAASGVLDGVAAVAEGRESAFELTGNAHSVTATVDGVVITPLWVEDAALRVTLAEFSDAVRTWRDFLIRAYGADS